jgi:hypothetical protein
MDKKIPIAMGNVLEIDPPKKEIEEEPCDFCDMWNALGGANRGPESCSLKRGEKK